eukprot:7589794-Pyramimonas_sp.AAC.1
MVKLRDAATPHVAELVGAVKLGDSKDVPAMLLGHRVRLGHEVAHVAQLAALPPVDVVLELDGAQERRGLLVVVGRELV